MLNCSCKDNKINEKVEILWFHDKNLVDYKNIYFPREIDICSDLWGVSGPGNFIYAKFCVNDMKWVHVFVEITLQTAVIIYAYLALTYWAFSKTGETTKQ